MAYDALWLSQGLADKGASANKPPKSNRNEKSALSPWHYKKRNFIDRFFNKLKIFQTHIHML